MFKLINNKILTILLSDHLLILICVQRSSGTWGQGSVCISIKYPWTDPEGGGPDPPPPPGKSQKYRVFSNTGPDPLENHKATKSSFHDWPLSAHQRNAIYMAFN